MDQQLAQQKFSQADTLFRQGQYNDALAILGELNTAFPNKKNIMYPAALCMEKLGRIEEAKQVCNSILQKAEDPKTQELLARLGGGMSPEDEIEALLNRPSPPPHPREQDTGGSFSGSFSGFFSGFFGGGNKNRKLFIILGILAALQIYSFFPSKKVDINEDIDFSTTIQTSQEEKGTHVVIENSPILTAAIIVFLLGLWIFHCYIGMRICINADSDPGILIWIPILQFIPLIIAARMGLLWLLLIFIPIFGWLVLYFVWAIKISIACDNPGVLGLLFFVPVIGPLMPLYLAFSE